MLLSAVAALLLGGCLSVTAPVPTSRPALPPPVAAPAGSAPSAVYGQLPLYFVENQGQVDQRVAYYGSVGRASVYFTAQGVTYALLGPGPASQPWAGQGVSIDGDRSQPPSDAAEATVERWAVAMDLIWAYPASRPLGLERTETIVSYFKGPPEAWKTGLPTYAAVGYAEPWPGIDLVYGQQDRQLKYSFLLEPGADPSQIRLEYRGTTAVRLDEAGRLVVATPLGELQESAPYVFQEWDGQRVEVAAAYDLVVVEETGTAQVGFRLGAYDPTRPLVIDPTVSIAYAGYVGGASNDTAKAIALGSDGSAYLAGSTASNETSFPVAVGPDRTFNGDRDAFVAKVNPSGTGLVYAGYIGGTDFEFANAIAVGTDGSAYVAGETASSEANFPVKEGPDLTFNGIDDAFVAKIDASGRVLIYAGYIGGTGSDAASGIAVDTAGNAYLAGRTRSTEASFPVRIGPDLTYNDDGGEDAFVAKVDASGRGLLYAGYIGDRADDMGRAIAVDPAGNAYVAGQTASKETGFPVREGPDLTFNVGTNIGDAFVAKVAFDPSTQTGTFVVAPTAATVRTGERLNLGFTWTVPAGRGWRSLTRLDLRLRDGDEIALWVTWDEAANTFQLVDPKTGKPGPVGKPGDPSPLQTEAATLHLAETSVLGPPGTPSVTLTLNLSFKPRAAGRTFQLEAAASDDLGAVDPFRADGSVTVVRGG